jgi:hypothetical protein
MDDTPESGVVRIDLRTLASRLANEQGRRHLSDSEAIIWLIDRGFRLRGGFWQPPDGGLEELGPQEIVEYRVFVQEKGVTFAKQVPLESAE